MSEVQVPIPGVEFSRLQIDIPDTYVAEDGNTYRRDYDEVIEDAVSVAKKLATRLNLVGQRNGGQPTAQTRSQPAQRPQGGGGQRGSTYPPQGLVSTLNDPDNWTCDKCGNTGEGVARRPQKGRMPGDAIVCLNPDCKEGDYRYTITFVEDGIDPDGPAIHPDDLPF